MQPGGLGAGLKERTGKVLRTLLHRIEKLESAIRPDEDMLPEHTLSCILIDLVSPEAGVVKTITIDIPKQPPVHERERRTRNAYR